MASAIRFSASSVTFPCSSVHRSPPIEEGARASSMSLKSIPCRWAGDAHAPAFALPPQSAIPRRRLAGFVAIGQHDHVADVLRQIEAAQPGGRKRGPGGMAARQHGGEAGLDTFADHQHVPWLGEAHRTATAGAEHHLLRRDRRLSRSRRAPDRCDELPAACRQRRASPAPPSPAICRPRGASDRDGSAARRGPAGGCRARRDRSRPAFPVPAWRIARWRVRPRFAWCRLDRACARRARGGPCAKADGGPSLAHRPRPRSAAMTRSWSQPAWQCTSTLPSSDISDRKARRAVVMRRAPRRPAAARLASAEGLGDGFSGHGAPRRWAVRRASVGGQPSRLGSVYPTF